MRYVARQPILTANERVLGYELLFRDGIVDYFSSADGDAASRGSDEFIFGIAPEGRPP